MFTVIMILFALLLLAYSLSLAASSYLCADGNRERNTPAKVSYATPKGIDQSSLHVRMGD
jgi:hypothetical protein